MIETVDFRGGDNFLKGVNRFCYQNRSDFFKGYRKIPLYLHNDSFYDHQTWLYGDLL